jgi:hypothetical protein
MLFWTPDATRVTDNFTVARAEGYTQNRNDLKTLEDAARVAASLSRATGVTYLPTDTPNCSPRFDVIEAPKVGDFVSHGFNGDAYPVGTIIAITPTWQCVIQREDGSTVRAYRRNATSGSWRLDGFSMIRGRHDYRNPSF